jgi:hypothetical protein
MKKNSLLISGIGIRPPPPISTAEDAEPIIFNWGFQIRDSRFEIAQEKAIEGWVELEL